MTRSLPALLLLVVSCATAPQAPPALPCTDDDAPRCLAFVKLVKEVDSRDGLVAQGLERHCLAGSLESCQQLATVRRDKSLEKLCKEGLADACLIPPDKVSEETLKAECSKREVGACQRLLTRVGPDKVMEFPRDLLEAGCSDGRAPFCFALSRQVKATEPERAKSLAWRSCLSGVTTACAENDESEARCAKGSDVACRSFELAAADDEAARGKKLKLLESACRAGAIGVCQHLARAGGLKPERLVELACTREATCSVVMVPSVATVACAGPEGLARDHGCAALLVGPALTGDGTEPVDPAGEAWAKPRCTKAPLPDAFKNVCRSYSGALERAGRMIEATRVKCTSPCRDEAALKSLDLCLSEQRTKDSCARAVLWLDHHDFGMSEGDLAVQRDVFGRACELGEASACEKAATRLQGQPQKSVQLYRRACTLGAKSACRFAEMLERDQQQCERGHCASWAQHFADLDVNLSMLEKTCASGEKADCEAWGWRVRKVPSRYVRVCAERGKPFCSKEDQALLAPLHKACTANDGMACGKLVAATTLSREGGDPTLVGWARNACEANDANGCFQLASWDDPEGKAAARACELNHNEGCHLAADWLWRANGMRDRYGSAKKALDTPELKRARELALKACKLESSEGCSLASEFLQSGVGGPADELESARLEEKARELRSSRYQW